MEDMIYFSTVNFSEEEKNNFLSKDKKITVIVEGWGKWLQYPGACFFLST